MKAGVVMKTYKVEYVFKNGKVFDTQYVKRARKLTEKQALALMGSMACNFTVRIALVETC